MHVPRVGRALARLVVFSLCVGFLLPTHARAASSPLIGEVAWAGSSLSTSDEWIELWNPGDTALSLDGYRLIGAGGEDLGIVFGPHDEIAPRSTFIIANFHSTDTRSNLAVQANVVTSTLSVSNETLSLSLLDASGMVIDRVGNGRVPFAGTSTQAGKASMVRVSPLLPGNEATSWVSAASATNLKTGVSDLGTPGICDQCSLIQTAIVVPENAPVVQSATAPEVAPPSPAVETAEPTPSPLSTSTEVIAINPDVASSSSTSSPPAITEPSVSESILVTSSTFMLEGTAAIPSLATTTPVEETVMTHTTSAPATSSTETVPVAINTAAESSHTNTVVTPATTLNTSSTNVLVTTSTTSNLNSNTSTTAIDLNVRQTTSSADTNSFHLQVALTLNNSVTIPSPAQDNDHDGENLKELIQLLKTLLKHNAFQVAAVLPEPKTVSAVSAASKKAAAAEKVEATETKKAVTTKANAKTATTAVKPKATTTKKASMATKKATTASKPAPMSTTISAAASIAQDAPHVALTGTVASPPQLLAKNQFVIQTPDGRGLLVLGNGKQPSPAINQTIRVEGTLVVNDDGLTLRMYTADRWSDAPTEVVREPRLVNLLSPSTEDEWSLIEVTGTVQSVAKQSVLLDLEDSEIRLKISPILDYRTERLKKGDVIRVRGLLGISKDEVAIHPRSASEITILNHATATVAQASTTSHSFPNWMPIGAAGATIAATHGVKRIQKYREQQRLNTMLTQAQDQLLSHVDLPSSHLV